MVVQPVCMCPMRILAVLTLHRYMQTSCAATMASTCGTLFCLYTPVRFRQNQGSTLYGAAQTSRNLGMCIVSVSYRQVDYRGPLLSFLITLKLSNAALIVSFWLFPRFNRLAFVSSFTSLSIHLHVRKRAC
ncbi:hypothetical protein F5Y06DRAFT_47954 [Hypoxylon sp. FL0890]|nr:hypothetical protein F5Y06DRAFT_47954 [Hypoxylon sp. FL0890]